MLKIVMIVMSEEEGIDDVYECRNVAWDCLGIDGGSCIRRRAVAWRLSGHMGLRAELHWRRWVAAWRGT